VLRIRERPTVFVSITLPTPAKIPPHSVELVGWFFMAFSIFKSEPFSCIKSKLFPALSIGRILSAFAIASNTAADFVAL